jgi:hypothetical protein
MDELAKMQVTLVTMLLTLKLAMSVNVDIATTEKIAENGGGLRESLSLLPSPVCRG